MTSICASIFNYSYVPDRIDDATARVLPLKQVVNSWRSIALGAVEATKDLPEVGDRWTACRPSPRVRKMAESVIEQIEREDLPVPLVGATIEGGIQFEWHNGRRELEIEILPEGPIEFLWVQDRKPIREGHLTGTELAASIKWLLEPIA